MLPRERKSFSAINVQAISQPRRSSAPSLSAFQVPARGSNNVVVHAPEAVSSSRPYLIAVIAILFGVIGVLTFLLLI